MRFWSGVGGERSRGGVANGQHISRDTLTHRVVAGLFPVRHGRLHTGNHYPIRRRSDTMDYLLLCVAVVIWVKYLC